MSEAPTAERMRHLMDECRHHAGNVIEVHAYAVQCERHMRHIRGCAWRGNAPCQCRAAVAAHFPEYADG